MDLSDVIRQVGSDLDALGARWALVGGLAVGVRSEPRFTRDVDFALAVGSDAAAENTVRALFARGYVHVATLEQQTTARLATVRLLPPGAHVEGVVADLLFASCGIEPEVVASATESLIVPGLPVRVATLAHLVAMKLLSERANRPQDGQDLLALLRDATAEDFALINASIALITERGFSREKDLVHTLERYRALAAAPD